MDELLSLTRENADKINDAERSILRALEDSHASAGAGILAMVRIASRVASEKRWPEDFLIRAVIFHYNESPVG